MVEKSSIDTEDYDHKRESKTTKISGQAFVSHYAETN